ncbi:MAG TPA: DnaB-like helicase N-terminal domain-containing protein [Terriglobales bacterium]|jgi:replicative DNA helicase|nr:DnaB-like helicase N-terminal domain-containing protein [Terriglobales bacterium]
MRSESQTDRPLPQNLDAERAILGAMLVDNESIPAMSEFLDGGDFFLPQHRAIYNACQALYASGSAVDLVLLCEALRTSGELEKAGGVPYVSALGDGIPRISDVKHHAKVVREAARRRRVIYLCHAVQEAAFAGEESAQKILENGASEFLSLMSQHGSASMPSTWESAVMGAMDEITEAIKNPGSTMRLKCGVAALDDHLGGLRRELVLGVGMTSHGKSLLAMQFAINGDNQGFKGLIFSAEMTKEALAERELSHASGVPLYLLRRPEMIESPRSIIESLVAAAAKETGRRLLVVDRDITPKRLWALCELVHKRNGLDFVIVDYDQLVVRAGLKTRDDEFRAQAEFMADALALQKRLNICFMLLCQPRKVDEDVARGRKPPRIEQIFGSSAAGNTAHVVWWIMREFFLHGMDPEYENRATAYILKARNDRTGVVRFGFDDKTVLFTNDSWHPKPKTGKNGRMRGTDDDDAQ